MSIDEIRSLVTERQRYDDWLTALETRRAESPVHVFDRVREDYVTRRDVVLLQLREYEGALTALGKELDGKRELLESELAALDDERVEAMLRTAVGEYDQEQWNVLRQDVEAKKGVFGEQRALLLVEIAEIRTLLSSACREPAAGEQSIAEVSVSVDLPEPMPAEAESIEAVSREDVESDAAAIDCIEIELNELPASSAIPVAPAPVAAEVDGSFSDPAFQQPVAAAPPMSADSALPSEPLKTLRCGECGTMNLPTEWYCERCGGELAAL